MTETLDLPDLLVAHLRQWVGAWPPQTTHGVQVVGNPRRAQPAWDGSLIPVAGVEDASGSAMLGIDPAHAETVDEFAQSHGGDVEAVLTALPDLLGRPGIGIRGAFRWTLTPPSADDLPDAGIWVDVDDQRVPPWLKPFGGEVLMALDGDTYVAGVGIKKHDEYGHELAVVTEEPARGRGLGRRLVAQAARRVVDEGRVPTYLHAPDNVASAKVAEATGFTDRSWRVLGFFPRRP